MIESIRYMIAKRKQSSIEELRILCLITAILTPLNSFVFYFNNPSRFSHLIIGFIFGSAFLALYIFSGKINLIHKKLKLLLIFMFHAGAVLTILIADQNNYDYDYIFLLFLIVIAISLVFDNAIQSVVSNAILICLLIAAIQDNPMLPDSKILIVSIYVLLSLLTYFGVINRAYLKKQLERSSDHLQNIVDNPVAGYFLINEEGKMSEINGKMMELYEAVDREELLGKTCHILNAGCDKNPLRCNCQDGNCCNSGKILKRNMKDGTVRHHLLWARRTPEYENGKVFEGLVFDVSDQILAEEETKRNLGKYNQLFQIIDQGIAILEAVFNDESRRIVDFRFIEVNRGYEKLTGFKNDNIRGKTMLEVMPEMEAYWIQAYSEVVIKKKHKYFERESKFLSKNFDIYAYFYEENKIGLMVSDITAKSQILEQLKSAIIKAEEINEAKNKFLRNITHELRTPMNSIMGLLQLFEMTDLDDEQIEDVELMKDASVKMLSLVNKIIHLIESEQSSSSEVSCFDLKQLTETLIRETKPAVSDEVILDCKLDSDIPDQLWGDHISLMKILEELLGNAVKFTEQGEITLSAKKVHTYRGKPETVMIELSVTDTGIGIEEERLPGLFQEFTQINTSVIKRYEGAGIGLALCRNLAEKMDAVINVHSELRKGSVFTVYVILSTDSNNR